MVTDAICGFEPTLLAKSEADEEFTMLLPMQCRAARGLLHWTQDDLSQRAGLSGATIRAFELEQTSPNPATLVVLRMAFEKAGVEFTNDDQPGVRMKGRKRK